MAYPIWPVVARCDTWCENDERVSALEIELRSSHEVAVSVASGRTLARRPASVSRAYTAKRGRRLGPSRRAGRAGRERRAWVFSSDGAPATSERTSGPGHNDSDRFLGAHLRFRGTHGKEREEFGLVRRRPSRDLETRAGGSSRSWTRSGCWGRGGNRSSIVDRRSRTAVAGCGYGATAVIDQSIDAADGDDGDGPARSPLDPRSIPAQSRLDPCLTTASAPRPLLSRHRVHVRTPREGQPGGLNATRRS